MPLNKLPIVADSEYIYDEYFKVRRDRLRLSHHDDYNYYTLVTASSAIMILPKTEKGRFVLNWEYRHPVEKVLLSCPGGVKHEDESPEEGAKRELVEETGYTAQSFELIGEAHPFPGICDQKTFYFRANNATHTHKKTLEKAEFIETVLFTSEELKKIIQQGVAVDGILLAALFLDQNRCS